MVESDEVSGWLNAFQVVPFNLQFMFLTYSNVNRYMHMLPPLPVSSSRLCIPLRETLLYIMAGLTSILCLLNTIVLIWFSDSPAQVIIFAVTCIWIIILNCVLDFKMIHITLAGHAVGGGGKVATTVTTSTIIDKLISFKRTLYTYYSLLIFFDFCTLGIYLVPLFTGIIITGNGEHMTTDLITLAIDFAHLHVFFSIRLLHMLLVKGKKGKQRNQHDDGHGQRKISRRIIILLKNFYFRNFTREEEEGDDDEVVTELSSVRMSKESRRGGVGQAAPLGSPATDFSNFFKSSHDESGQGQG